MTTPLTPWSDKAAELILDNLQDRKGIGNALDQIDDDIKDEIKAAVAEIMRETFLTQEGTDPGDVRMLGGRTGNDAEIQVSTGSEWLKLNGVIHATCTVKAGGQSSINMRVYSKRSIFMANRDNVAVAYLADQDDSDT